MKERKKWNHYASIFLLAYRMPNSNVLTRLKPMSAVVHQYQLFRLSRLRILAAEAVSVYVR